MGQRVQEGLRAFLPVRARRALVRPYVWFRRHIWFSLRGLIFDLRLGVFEADGCSFIIPKNVTTLAFRAGFLGDDYEKDERSLVARYIASSDSVLEIGACLGVVSSVVNRRLSRPDRHMVVEANPLCIGALETNRDRNNAAFSIRHCAVAVGLEQVQLFLDPHYIVAGSTHGRRAKSILVPARSLRQLVDEFGPVSVLIMDIEGSELEVLESEERTVAGFRLVIVELHDWLIGEAGVQRCRSVLRKAGLHLSERSGRVEAWTRELPL